MAKVRVLRVIEYVGEYEDVKEQLEESHIPNNGQKFYSGVMMKSALVGDFPEELSELEGRE